MSLVEPATDSDLDALLGWLETEYHEDSRKGFWLNRNGIEEKHRKYGELYVTRDGAQPVSFHVGHYSPWIVSTRKTHRRQLLAKAHLAAAIARARAANVNILDIECEPRESWKNFWEGQGFRRYGNMSALGDITARMVIETRQPLPAGARKAVRVDFCPEDVKYKDGTAPLYGWSLDAAQLSDGSCQLPKRLVGIRGDLRNGRDMVVCIIVNGRTVYFDEAKYEEARRIGVEWDRHGDCFYIDRITPVRNGGE